MHELGIMTGVMDSTLATAKEAGATKVLSITLRIGRMTEAIEDALQFAFDAVKENTIAQDATLEVIMVEPKSVCLSCGTEYEHDRFHMLCPACESPFTQLVQGKELEIASIEVELPDEEDDENREDSKNGETRENGENGETGEGPATAPKE